MRAAPPAIRFRGVTHRYAGREVVRSIDLTVAAGRLVGVVGPDGIGKSTVLALAAGVRRLQVGAVEVFGGSMADRRHRHRVRRRIGYLPQGLAPNLYPELTAVENADLIGRLFGLDSRTIRSRADRFWRATGLSSAVHRPVRQLSGGMRQKVGLCCALIHDPDLLVLDEPTTGIDPLSRRQLWDLVARFRSERAGLTVLAASGYLEEAREFDWLAMLDQGGVIAQGTPADLVTRTGAASLEDAYARLLPPSARPREAPAPRAPPPADSPVTVEARAVRRRFGPVTAVAGVDLAIRRGEIFGLAGPNGSGKTTLLKMISGQLEPSEGEVRVLGAPVDPKAVPWRRRIGYLSQGFSLYAELSVRQNLVLHAHLFGVPPSAVDGRVRDLSAELDLGWPDALAQDLPLGVRQRLSLAVAVIHRPELLVLDEPTSGVDPAARERLWSVMTSLAREHQTTLVLSTHYLTEASRCDRVALMHEGRVVACEPPLEIARRHGGDLERAFVALISPPTSVGPAPTPEPPPATPASRLRTRGGPSRLAALVRREIIDIARDPFRLIWAIAVPMLLLAVFGSGLMLNIDHVPFAARDDDRTPASRELLDAFRASSYFVERALEPGESLDDALRRGTIRFGLEIPAGFGRAVRQGRIAEVGAIVDGTMPYRAETVTGYLDGIVHGRQHAFDEPIRFAPRQWFNQGLVSQQAFVPALLAVILLLIPATLAAISVAREKELGTVGNLAATPMTPVEFLLAKQICYTALGAASLVTLLALVRFGFGIVPGGALASIYLGALPFLLAGTGLGALVGALTRSQAAAVLVTMIVILMPSFQYSGLLSPIASLQGSARWFAACFPTTYFRQVSVGVITKGLGWGAVARDVGVLALFSVALSATAAVLTPKQQR